MKNILLRNFMWIALLMLTSFSYADNTNPDAVVWPKTINANNQQFLLYQPQIENYEGNNLNFIMAVSVQQGDQPIYGTVSATCNTDVNKTDKVVSCEQIQIKNINFPSLNDQQQVSDALNQSLNQQSFELSLDQLQSSLKLSQINQIKSQNTPLQFVAPKIYAATTPTVLVLIDGEPELRNIPNSALMRVINTSFIIILDSKSGTYYLQAGSNWMTATNIMGPWTLASNVPQAIQNLETDPATYGKNDQTSSTEISNIIVNTKPSALIQMNGQPEFTPIENTNLLYVSNSNDTVFFQIGQQEFYVLLSGRWYKSKSLSNDASWSYVKGSDLPDTFKKIPSNSPKGNALVSIPNTMQAQEAMIHNQIPQTAKVSRKTANVTVSYDGEPKFKAIPGTDMSYALNTSSSVIQLNNNYYVNYQGVWFISAQAMGPWVVLTEVPDVIYTIPPSIPIYPVTYSYIYNYDPDYVYVGYTGGYLGSYIIDNALVFGTGYLYQPWVGNVYYGWPITFGFGFNYNWYTGWWHVGVHYNSPYWYGWGLRIGGGAWGPVGWHTGWFGVAHGAVFDNNVNISRNYNFNPTINMNNSHNIYNRWDKNVVANKWNQDNLQRFNNRLTQNNLSQKFNSNQQLQQKMANKTSNLPLKVTDKQPEVQQKVAGQRQKIDDQSIAKQQARARNDVYAGHDGRVYQYHQQQGWQAYDNQQHNWQDAEARTVPNELDSERIQRARGMQLNNNFDNWNHQYSGGGFGGRSFSRFGGGGFGGGHAGGGHR